VSKGWKFGQFFFWSFFDNNSKATRIIFELSWLCASWSLMNAFFFVSVSFCHFWKFYEVFCFVVHLHWNDTNVHSLSLTWTVSLILLFTLPFYWWQFETVWFLNNVYSMLICFKEMHIYKWNSLCFCRCLYNTFCIFLLCVLLLLCAFICAHSLHNYFEIGEKWRKEEGCNIWIH
jgi:hypothetical protein